MVMKGGDKRGGRGGRGGRGAGKQRQDIRGRSRPSGVAQGGNGRNNGWGAAVEDLQHNELFEAYYIDQEIMPFEQWQSFLDHMRAPLPTSFRFTSGKPVTDILLKQMEDFYLPYLSNIEFEGQPIPSPKSLPWYPGHMAWQIDVKKNALRKTEQFKKFQQFLVHETEVGNISRQETVSMVPPLFLGVEPHHIVLDMCAAPGSKTAQLIEALHSPLTTSSETYDPCPAGIVVANDSEAKRAHMLVHQSSRLPSPNLVVTNCDATRWPTVKVPWMAEGTDKVVEKPMKYDRILADVPCSGDGTIRKNLMIWQDWHPLNGAALHPLQVRILMKGLSNLRNGGRLVYSTCSLNPVEDEAVIAAALRECKGTVQLVDQTDIHPELIREKGKTTWKVLPTRGKQKFTNTSIQKDESKEDVNPDEPFRHAAPGSVSKEEYRNRLPALPWASTFDELDDDLKEKVPQSLFPQGDEEDLRLDRCMRILPQAQNTGGFFVAVLEKFDENEEKLDEGMAMGMIRAMEKRQTDENLKANESAILESSKKRSSSPQPQEGSSKRLKLDKQGGGDDQAEVDTKTADIGLPGGTSFREDPMYYVDIYNEQSQRIVDFFKLSQSFDPRNLLVRNRDANPLRSVYLTSTSSRALISGGGPGKGDHPYGNALRMRMINCGVRAFARQDSGKDAALKCKWRMTSDAVPPLRPLMGDDKVLSGTLEDFAFLTSNHYPKLSDLPQGPFRQALEAAEMGSYLMDVQPGNWGDHVLQRVMSVPLWRAAASVNLMLDRQEKSALSCRLFGKDLSNPSGARQIGKTTASKAKESSKPQTITEEIDEDEMQALENSTAVGVNEKPVEAEAPEAKAAIEEEGQEFPWKRMIKPDIL